MPVGSPIDRQWVFMLEDGRVAIEWSDTLFLDVTEGTFLPAENKLISHTILDKELDVLVRAGIISQFDTKKVYFYNLPEQPKQTIE
jgi:hypothetical protein